MVSIALTIVVGIIFLIIVLVAVLQLWFAIEDRFGLLVGTLFIGLLVFGIGVLNMKTFGMVAF